MRRSNKGNGGADLVTAESRNGYAARINNKLRPRFQSQTDPRR